jgi:chromatin segregation and condensation protein Rec8/ScpA/Scc1 (kleisin family)
VEKNLKGGKRTGNLEDMIRRSMKMSNLRKLRNLKRVKEAEAEMRRMRDNVQDGVDKIKSWKNHLKITKS